MPGDILVDLAARPLLDFGMYRLAQPAQRLGRRDDDQIAIVAGQCTTTQLIGGFRDEARLLDLVRVGRRQRSATRHRRRGATGRIGDMIARAGIGIFGRVDDDEMR